MLEVYRKILDLMTPREKRRFYLLMLLMPIMGLLEAISVGSVLPFLTVLSTPEMISENPWLSRIYDLGGFETEKQFVIVLGLIVHPEDRHPLCLDAVLADARLQPERPLPGRIP